MVPLAMLCSVCVPVFERTGDPEAIQPDVIKESLFGSVMFRNGVTRQPREAEADVIGTSYLYPRPSDRGHLRHSFS